MKKNARHAKYQTSSLLEVQQHFYIINNYITSQNHKVQNIWFHSHQKLMDLVFLI